MAVSFRHLGYVLIMVTAPVKSTFSPLSIVTPTSSTLRPAQRTSHAIYAPFARKPLSNRRAGCRRGQTSCRSSNDRMVECRWHLLPPFICHSIVAAQMWRMVLRIRWHSLSHSHKHTNTHTSTEKYAERTARMPRSVLIFGALRHSSYDIVQRWQWHWPNCLSTDTDPLTRISGPWV